MFTPRNVLRLFAAAILAIVHWGCGTPTTTGWEDELGTVKQCQLSTYAKGHKTIFDARVHSGKT